LFRPRKGDCNRGNLTTAGGARKGGARKEGNWRKTRGQKVGTETETEKEPDWDGQLKKLQI